MKKLYTILMLFIGTICFLGSCSDPNEKVIDGRDSEKKNNIDEIVTKNTSATAIYSNYGWEISLYTSLSSALPNKYIKYGVMCGYNGDNIYYSKYYNFSGNSYNTKEVVFIEGSDYTEDFFYYEGLIELQNKSNLSESEKDFMNEVLYFFKSSEPKAKSKYWGQLFAEIDGKKYIIKEYGNKFENNSSNSSSGGSTNNSGSGTSSYEKPEIGFYDYTAYRTSLKVQYKIYNSAEAGVSSAKVYYGTTSNPSTYKTATVNGTLITANITGLKDGTIYYVKCVATGKGGTSTTSVTKCITNY